MAPAASDLDVRISVVHPAVSAVRTGARLPWQHRLTEAGGVLFNASESLTAAAAVVDLVIEDLSRFAPGDLDGAIAELYEIRTSIGDIARKAAAAADRAG